MTTTAPSIECGIHQGIPFDQYLAIDALSQSAIKAGLRSMAHMRVPPKPATDAMNLGTLVHSCQLEPERVANTHVVMDDSGICREIGGAKPRATTKYKTWRSEWEAVHEDQEIVSAEDFDKATDMVRSLAEHPVAHRLFGRQGGTEATLVWECPMTGLRCKARFDALTTDDWPTGGDLKTTQDASEEAFVRSIIRYGYHIQAAWYCHGHRVLTGTLPNFVIVAVESVPPYAVNTFEIGEDWLVIGTLEYERVLRQYKRCLETGEFPAYAPEIINPSVPKWLKDKYSGDNE